MLKIDFSGGWLAVPCPWLYGPGFLDCLAVGPRLKNSKMITADEKWKMAEKAQLVLDRVKSIVGKGEIVGYHYLLFLPQCFPKATFPGSFKTWNCLSLPLPNE